MLPLLVIKKPWYVLKDKVWKTSSLPYHLQHYSSLKKKNNNKLLVTIQYN